MSEKLQSLHLQCQTIINTIDKGNCGIETELYLHERLQHLKIRIKILELQPSDFSLPASDFALPPSDFSLPASDFALPPSGFSLPASSFVLQTPNPKL